ncbi:MAG: peroxidase family protein [Planctomycetota bacterium]
MPLVSFQNESVIDESDDTLTLLQISQKHGIPHMHVCGGMARCSTCRVMVLEHPENLSPRNTAEKNLATRLGFEDNIRLACQCQVTGPVTVRRLTLDDQDAGLCMSGDQRTTGREAKIAVLFSDIRGFTTFSETSLPYDTIHILNRYFYQMGEAVLHNEGYIDKYMGDGLMALFGLNCDNAETNCRNAVNAGLQMLTELEGFNDYMKRNFGREFKIGIGIHFGELIIGEMGHPSRRSITVIGDTVNMASRIESATKEAGAPILISDAVRDSLRGRVDIGRSFTQVLKGKSGSYSLHEVLNLREQTVVMTRTGMMRNWIASSLRCVVTLRSAPLFLRAAFHDAGTYDSVTNTGGCSGTLHLPEVYSRPENAGLEIVVNLLMPIKKHFEGASWADLFIVAGSVAVKTLGGPDIPVALGRKDAKDQVPQPGVMDLEHYDIKRLKERFLRMGLTIRDMVALSGAHTVGHNRGAPFTYDWYKFNNSYFRQLLQGAESSEHMLGTDRALAHDPECFEWVKKYALDEAMFFADFSAAYQKMSKLGTNLK